MRPSILALPPTVPFALQYWLWLIPSLSSGRAHFSDDIALARRCVPAGAGLQHGTLFRRYVAASCFTSTSSISAYTTIYLPPPPDPTPAHPPRLPTYPTPAPPTYSYNTPDITLPTNALCSPTTHLHCSLPTFFPHGGSATTPTTRTALTTQHAACRPGHFIRTRRMRGYRMDLNRMDADILLTAFGMGSRRTSLRLGPTFLTNIPPATLPHAPHALPLLVSAPHVACLNAPAAALCCAASHYL